MKIHLSQYHSYKFNQVTQERHTESVGGFGSEKYILLEKLLTFCGKSLAFRCRSVVFRRTQSPKERLGNDLVFNILHYFRS